MYGSERRVISFDPDEIQRVAMYKERNNMKMKLKDLFEMCLRHGVDFDYEILVEYPERYSPPSKDEIITKKWNKINDLPEEEGDYVNLYGGVSIDKENKKVLLHYHY